MFCKNCGAQIEEGVAVCPECGQAVPVAQKGKANEQTSNSTSVFKGNYKSKDGKILTGVCAGMGKRYGKNPWVFRAGFIIAGFIPILGWFLLGYYIAAIFMWKYEDELN